MCLLDYLEYTYSEVTILTVIDYYLQYVPTLQHLLFISHSHLYSHTVDHAYISRDHK